MCRVREIDRIGNNQADAAATLGRERVHHSVAFAREVVTRSCARLLPDSSGASSLLHCHC